MSGCASDGVTRRGMGRVGDGLGAAVTAPLEDLNLKREPIPGTLLKAVNDPYDLQGLNRCEGLAAEVARLDAALGPDLDEPPPPDTRDNKEKGADMAADATLGAVRSAARDVIPFRGWVRRLSGAERHSKEVQAAITAGKTRRGFLKGMGMNMNCAPPAAPRWFVPRTTPQRVQSQPRQNRPQNRAPSSARSRFRF